jgi:hypothetical protein
MLSRGARAERQRKLQLLESVRLETDAAHKKLEEKLAAIPDLTPAQAEKVFARVRAMSADEIIEFFQDYPLRMAGKNRYCHHYGNPREMSHTDDPELAAAVEAVNLAVCAYDKARLKLRVTEFFGGRVSPLWSNSALIQLDILEILISFTKMVSFEESLRGGDRGALERENFKQVWRPEFAPAL